MRKESQPPDKFQQRCARQKNDDRKTEKAYVI